MSQATEAASCAHCGLPLPADQRTADRRQGETDAPRYCCLGCRFAASLVASSNGADAAATETLTRLGLSIFFAMNVMVFTMALWSQDVYGQFGQDSAIALHDVFRYLALMFSLPVLFLLGGPLLEEAALAIGQRRISTDLLLAVGVVAAFVYSAVAVLAGSGHVYFEVVCMILVAVTLGRWMEATGKVRTTEALRSLQRLLPEQVRLVTADGEQSLPLDELAAGQSIRIAAGQRVAADGIVVSGSAAVDQQVVTGESQPVEKSSGDRVLAGCLNLDGDLVVCVQNAPGESTIDRLVATVTHAARQPERWGRFADRITSWFLPCVASTALLTCALHAWRGRFAEGLMAALAVTVVACPCALALAAPLAIWNAFGRAARRGIIIRNADAMSRLRRVRNYCFDKTGTLTTGQPTVDRIIWNPQGGASRELIQQVAVALARTSTHPASAAIGQCLNSPAPLVVDNLRAVSGRGLIGAVAEIDALAMLGSRTWMDQHGQAIPPALEAQIANVQDGGQSVTFVGWSGQVQAAFVLAEQLRSGSRDVIRTIRDRGDHVVVLTGDDRARGAVLSRYLGVPVLAEQLPEDKLNQIESIRQQGLVAMLGDGINDAPALAVADVGIAMGCGADVARQTADVCLLGNDLRQLFDLERISDDAVRTIRWNLIWSLGYNVLAIPIAAAGWLNPIIAALAMALSSALVVGSSLKLSHDDPADSRSALPQAKQRRAEIASPLPAGTAEGIIA